MSDSLLDHRKEEENYYAYVGDERANGWFKLEYNARQFLVDGLLHSVNDEPAIVCNDNSAMFWYRHGKRHRRRLNGTPKSRGPR